MWAGWRAFHWAEPRDAQKAAQRVCPWAVPKGGHLAEQWVSMKASQKAEWMVGQRAAH